MRRSSGFHLGRAGEMSEAILLAVARNPELQIRVRDLSRAAGRAMMKRFLLGTGLLLKASPPIRDLLAIARGSIEIRSEEKQVVGEGRNQRHPIGVGTAEKAVEEKRGGNPAEPFHLYRQNEEEIDDLFGIKSGKGEKEGGRKHAIGKLRTEEESGGGGP